MLSAVLEANLAEPTRGFHFGSRFRLSTGKQRHRDIFKGGELRQKVVKLPDIADFAVTKLGGIILGKRIHLGVGAVYGTGGGPIKRRQDVQQGTLPGTRLSDDRQHRAFVDGERQILKEHEFCVA